MADDRSSSEQPLTIARTRAWDQDQTLQWVEDNHGDRLGTDPAETIRSEPGTLGLGTFPEATGISDFMVVGKLGQGGMGEVQRARQLSLQREVALKCLRADMLSAETRGRMLREAQ